MDTAADHRGGEHLDWAGLRGCVVDDVAEVHTMIGPVGRSTETAEDVIQHCNGIRATTIFDPTDRGCPVPPGLIVGVMTRILLISGSTREGSLHTAVLRTAARLAPTDITATLYDGLRSLPAFVPGEPTLPDGVALLRHRVDAADAVLFSTPEYAGSIPGSLKNLLDWLVDGDELDGKPVAWLSVSAPGQDDGARATLETVLGHGDARVLRSACIRIPLSPHAVDAQGDVTDARLHMALLDMLHALARSLAAPRQPQPPSWQAYSSLYPVVTRSDTPAFRNRRAQA
jgi:chromate reductase